VADPGFDLRGGGAWTLSTEGVEIVLKVKVKVILNVV